MKIRLVLFALASSIPHVSAAFDCATDQGMELVAGGSYREAQQVWVKIPDDPASRAASQIMAQWGELSRFEPEDDSLSSSASNADLTAFLDALLRCPSSRQRGANLLLGTAHLGGVGVERNVVRAKRFFSAAAARGDALSRVALAALARKSGHSAESKKHLKKARSSGQIDDFTVGQLLFKGCIFEQDYVEAARWFEAGSSVGDPRSQRAYAFMLLLGIGVQKDQRRAEALFAEAEDKDPTTSKMPDSFIVSVESGKSDHGH